MLIKVFSHFNHIFFDIWDGYNTHSLCGAHSFFMIVDDFSHTIWLYLMHFKSTTYTHLMHFLPLSKINSILVLNSFALRTNKNFFLTNFKPTYINIHERTYVETVWQNGIVECKYRHILNGTCSLQFQPHLLLSFWRDYIITASYLINRTPNHNVQNKSPLEILFNKIPN